MPSTRNLVLITAAAFSIGAVGIVVTKRAQEDTPVSTAQRRQAAAPRVAREESVWEKAASEKIAHEEAQQLAVLERAAQEMAEREQAEIERTAQQQTEAQQEALARLARDRASRIESAMAGTALGGARLRANENAAIATLRSIASAQAQCQAMAAIDTNANGRGEYAFLAEMAGTVPTRQYDPSGTVIGEYALAPPVLSTAMGQVQDGGSGDGAIEHTGYRFKVFLPGAQGTGIAEAVTGGATGGVLESIDPKLSEKHWCAYAWPMTAGTSGLRAFFISEKGELLQHANTDKTYDGPSATPTFADAYATEAMTAPLSQDWTAVQ